MRVVDEWWTSPTESENGKLIMVTGRRGVESVMQSGKFNDRVEISWKYDSDDSGMPDKETAMLMEAVDESLKKTFKKDPIAVITGIYTGDGERNWVMYVKNINIFNNYLNKALAQFPLLPLELYAEKDPEWDEYKEMKDLSYIDDGD